MTGTLHIALSFLFGMLGGLVFFRLLWRSVEGLSGASRPVLHVLAGMALRFALALVLFFIVARYGDWHDLLAATAGFSLPRFWMTRRAVDFSTYPGARR